MTVTSRYVSRKGCLGPLGTELPYGSSILGLRRPGGWVWRPCVALTALAKGRTVLSAPASRKKEGPSEEE